MRTVAMLPTANQRLLTWKSAAARKWLVLGVSPPASHLHTMAAASVRGNREYTSLRALLAKHCPARTTRAPMRADRTRFFHAGASRCRPGRIAVIGSGAAFAQNNPSNLPLLIGQGAGGTTYSVPIQTLLMFTALSFLPAVLLLMTGFTRIVIVLSLLRQALGTQAAPPNQVIVGLSLFLTLFVMGPTIDKIYAQAYEPLQANKISFNEALSRGEVPLREFMLKQTRQSDALSPSWPLPPEVKSETYRSRWCRRS
jgi:hypothetical protein